MRLVITLIALVALSGCDTAASRCDEAIKKKLKAPSTYKRISADGSETIMRVEFDAENSFGVPIRDKAECFPSNSPPSAFLESEVGPL